MGIGVINVRINAFKFYLDLELNNLISHIPLKHQGCNSPCTNTVSVGLQLLLNYINSVTVQIIFAGSLLPQYSSYKSF